MTDELRYFRVIGTYDVGGISVIDQAQGRHHAERDAAVRAGEGTLPCGAGRLGYGCHLGSC
ncbi:hypothetical protein GCM10023405_47000 [Streptomonospora salina]